MTARLVPDCGGLIDEMAMTIPLRLLAASPSPKGFALGRLVDALPPRVTLFLMTDDPDAVAFRAWYRTLTPACDVQIITTGTAQPIQESEMWTQDPWMAAEEDGALFLHHLLHTDRLGRQAVWLAGFRPTPCNQPPLHLAGGNALTGPDFRLLGAQSLDLTQRIGPGPMDEAEALRRHEALDSRPPHIFGFPLPVKGSAPVELRQQPHHVDLVVSLTGRRVLDGGANEGRHIIMVADPRKTLDPDGPRMEGWAEQLDASAMRLAAAGFHIIRNKVPHIAHPAFSPNPTLRAYNNVILENDVRSDLGKSRPLVWLPHFADLEPELAPYDAENAALWEGLGFEIVPVYGWSALVRSGGAIRCASKVLRRKKSPVNQS